MRDKSTMPGVNIRNAMQIIQPYKISGGVWVFDDPNVGLVSEPFVAGIPEMIEVLVADIEAAEDGFLLYFSPLDFASVRPKHRLVKVADDMGGAWYRARLDGECMHGWLCPALLKYFSIPPEQIWVSAFPLAKEEVLGPTGKTVPETIEAIQEIIFGPPRASIAELTFDPGGKTDAELWYLVQEACRASTPAWRAYERLRSQYIQMNRRLQ